MELYVVYFQDERSSGYGDYKWVYLNLNEALESLVREQQQYATTWVQLRQHEWISVRMTCGIYPIKIYNFRDNELFGLHNIQTSEIWIIFTGSKYMYTQAFTSELEARNYLHTNVKNPNEWIETTHNHWICEQFDLYLKRFDILEGNYVKGAIDD